MHSVPLNRHPQPAGLAREWREEGRGRDLNDMAGAVSANKTENKGEVL